MANFRMTTATTTKSASLPGRNRSGAAAICLTGAVARGLTLAWSGKTYRVASHFSAEKHDLAGRKNDLLGLPLEKLFIKNIPLPPLSRKDLQKAVELQSAFHLPYGKDVAEFTHQLASTPAGNNLLLLATEKFACG